MYIYQVSEKKNKIKNIRSAQSEKIPGKNNPGPPLNNLQQEYDTNR